MHGRISKLAHLHACVQLVYLPFVLDVKIIPVYTAELHTDYAHRDVCDASTYGNAILPRVTLCRLGVLQLALTLRQNDACCLEERDFRGHQ